MKRPAILIAVLVGGALALALLSEFASRRNRPASTPAETDAAAEPQRAELDQDQGAVSLREPVGVQEQPAEPDEVAQNVARPSEEPANPSVSPVEPVEKRPRIPGDHFEAMYAGWRLEELAGAKARLEVEFQRAMGESVDACIEAGRYETVLRERATNLDEAMANAKPWPNDDRIHSEQTEVKADGSLGVKVITVPYAEYIHVYDKQDELNWLMTKIHKLQSEQ